MQTLALEKSENYKKQVVPFVFQRACGFYWSHGRPSERGGCHQPEPVVSGQCDTRPGGTDRRQERQGPVQGLGPHQALAKRPGRKQQDCHGNSGFIFVRTIFVQKRKMFTFSRAHSHALTNATRCHKYFRGLSRLLPVPGVLVSFLELRFLGNMALLALGGRPQPLKKPSQSQKGHFYKIMNAPNDTKTSAMSKTAEGNREYL